MSYHQVSHVSHMFQLYIEQQTFSQAVSAYNAALREDAVPPADAAVVHSNAAQV